MIRNMLDKGLIISEVSRQMGIDRKTVRKYAKNDSAPETKPRTGRSSKLDPYRDSIRELVDRYNLSTVRILDEIRKLGYDGERTILGDYCTTLRKDRRVQAAIDRLRKDSPAEPVIQSDNGSAFISMEFKIVLKENHLTHKRIRPHTPEQNGIVEISNKTTREALAPVILVDYEQAKSEISGIIEHYNNRRRHSSLQYLTPVQYYRGEPEILLAVREAKIEKAKLLRKERNMEARKGGETAGTVS